MFRAIHAGLVPGHVRLPMPVNVNAYVGVTTLWSRVHVRLPMPVNANAYVGVTTLWSRVQGRLLKGCWLCRAVEAALVPGHTRLLMLESPTNPRMQICDIQTLTQLAHKVSLYHMSAL